MTSVVVDAGTGRPAKESQNWGGRVWVARVAAMPLMTCALAVAVLLAASTHSALILQFDRQAISAGAAWRLLTCHLTHWSADHLIWDLAGMVILGWWCERRSRVAMVCCVLLSAAAIGLGVWWLLPAMEFYRGVSGIDSALFGLLVTMLVADALVRHQWQTAAWPALAMLLFAVKLGIEFTTQSAVFVQTPGMVPVPLAHALGLACGLTTGILGTVTSGSRGLRDITSA